VESGGAIVNLDIRVTCGHLIRANFKLARWKKREGKPNGVLLKIP
jgi:hypothetical protein